MEVLRRGSRLLLLTLISKNGILQYCFVFDAFLINTMITYVYILQDMLLKGSVTPEETD